LKAKEPQWDSAPCAHGQVVQGEAGFFLSSSLIVPFVLATNFHGDFSIHQGVCLFSGCDMVQRGKHSGKERLP
jgi:hypothetical protein